MKNLYKILGAIVFLSLVLLQTSCTALSTGSSMQIDVEVYKGPLSKEPSAQWDELLGIIKEARNTFLNANLAIQNIGVKGVEEDWVNIKICDKKFANKNGGEGDDFSKIYFQDYKTCVALISLFKKTEYITNELGGKTDEIEKFKNEISLLKITQKDANKEKSNLINDARKCNVFTAEEMEPYSEPLIRKLRNCYKQVLNNASTIAGELMAQSFVSAESHVGFANKNRLVRGLQISFANMASEYGNQISSRADALLKQMKGENRRTMPLSTYLRDAGETDFLNLYVWDHAGAPSLCEEGCLDLKEITRNRVRVVERMYQDHNWERINRVEASGQGNVSMAFIKDDVGNWNLKNFKNDPSELLNAYKEVGKASVVAAKNLIAESVTGKSISAAKKALDFASEAALGNGGSKQLAQDSQLITALKNRSIKELEVLSSNIENEKTVLDTSIKAAKEEVGKQEIIKNDKKEILDNAISYNGGKSIEMLKVELELHRKEAAVLSGKIESDTKNLSVLQSNGGSSDDIKDLTKKIADNKSTLADYVKTIIETETKIGTLEQVTADYNEANNNFTTANGNLTNLNIQKEALGKKVKDSTNAIVSSYSNAIDTLEGLAAEAY